MRSLAISITLILISFLASAQIKHGLRDENGRHVISRGFMVDKITQESAVQSSVLFGPVKIITHKKVTLN